MNKHLILIAAAGAGLLGALPAMAHDRVGVSVTIGNGYAPPAVYSPPPVVYAPPPPVVYRPRPVIVQPAPVVQYRYYGRDWREREWHRRHEHWHGHRHHHRHDR